MYDGLHALKSAFYFSDCIIELGSDITSSNPDFKEITTAVDQTRLCGEVTYGDAVNSRPEDEAPGPDAETSVQWTHHNNRGYVSLDGAEMKVSEAVQRGKWDWIDPAYHDRWDETPVFKCWFDHTADLGETGSASYAFAVLPCATAEKTAAFFATLTDTETSPVKVLLNTRDCQAVEHSGVICAAIHTAGRYEVCDLTFESDAPCLLILDGSSETKEVLPKPKD